MSDQFLKLINALSYTTAFVAILVMFYAALSSIWISSSRVTTVVDARISYSTPEVDDFLAFINKEWQPTFTIKDAKIETFNAPRPSNRDLLNDEYEDLEGSIEIMRRILRRLPVDFQVPEIESFQKIAIKVFADNFAGYDSTALRFFDRYYTHLQKLFVQTRNEPLLSRFGKTNKEAGKNFREVHLYWFSRKIMENLEKENIRILSEEKQLQNEIKQQKFARENLQKKMWVGLSGFLFLCFSALLHILVRLEQNQRTQIAIMKDRYVMFMPGRSSS